jgi:hypothetical protein
MSEVTPQIVKAMEHVRSVFPTVCMVVFSKDGAWNYMDDCFNAPSFEGTGIDTGILEDARDSAPEFPFIYQIDLEN